MSNYPPGMTEDSLDKLYLRDFPIDRSEQGVYIGHMDDLETECVCGETLEEHKSKPPHPCGIAGCDCVAFEAADDERRTEIVP